VDDPHPPVMPQIIPLKKRGRTKDQYTADLAHNQQAMRAFFRETAIYNRKRREALGCPKYTWHASGADDCDIARRNDGKTFSSSNPPEEGHPGEGLCNSGNVCRCFAAIVIPGIK
jgi:uncharacterized protein with gpF-like domain